MEQCSRQSGGNYPLRAAARFSAIRCPSLRNAAVLVAGLLVPLQSVVAEDIPTATANAELVAFAGAREYAESPQLTHYTSQTGEASLRAKSLTYIAREFAQLMVRDMRASMREQSAHRVSSNRARIRSRYDLRVSDDKFVVRMKYRF